MGRWAQRRRAGGGQSAGLQMTFAERTTVDEATITFSGPTTDADTAQFQFTSFPSGEGSTVIQLDLPNSLSVEFTGDVSSDTYVLLVNAPHGFSFPSQRDWDV